jgi:hypothetical protein
MGGYQSRSASTKAVEDETTPLRNVFDRIDNQPNGFDGRMKS